MRIAYTAADQRNPKPSSDTWRAPLVRHNHTGNVPALSVSNHCQCESQRQQEGQHHTRPADPGNRIGRDLEPLDHRDFIILNDNQNWIPKGI